ncbi:MAG: metal ABC transporter ATP-binding protein [Planctomycetota bacterium]
MAAGADLPLDVVGLTVAYDAVPVVWDASLRLERGRLLAIVGPNGAGKSSLIKAVLGMVPRVAGRVRSFGLDPGRDRSRVAYVPQRTSVDWDFPASVLDVVVMGTYGKLGWFRRPRRAEREAAREALATVEMEDFEGRQISELSGGQQQRVFLARALVQKADLYLMDEPFAGVDAVTERAIVTILQRLRDEGTTIVCVHHDLTTVAETFDDVALLNREIVAFGPVEEAFTRENVEATYGGRVATAFDRMRPAAAPAE